MANSTRVKPFCYDSSNMDLLNNDWTIVSTHRRQLYLFPNFQRLEWIEYYDGDAVRTNAPRAKAAVCRY